MVTYILAIILIAFIFDFINGFHDSANSIATIVGTRVLSPFAAVLWAALFNFAALFIGSTAVAKAVATGFVRNDIVDPNLIFATLLGAIAWNLITWVYGIPSSSSHALIGGLAGAGLAKAGLSGITFGRKWIETLSAIALSPMLGALMGFLLMALVFNVFRRATPRKVDRVFRPGQLLSSALLSLAHGGNDAQKTMGIIVGLLASRQAQAAFAGQGGVLRYFYVTNANIVPPLWGRNRGDLDDFARDALWRLADRAHDGLAHYAAAAGGRVLRGDRRRAGHPDRVLPRDPGEHDAHDHRVDRRRGGDQPAERGPLGASRADRLGVDPDDSGGGADGGGELLRAAGGGAGGERVAAASACTARAAAVPARSRNNIRACLPRRLRACPRPRSSSTAS